MYVPFNTSKYTTLGVANPPWQTPFPYTTQLYHFYIHSKLDVP